MVRARCRGLHELYRADPERADALIFGRRPEPTSRRGFLKGLGAMSAVLGADIVFGRYMPSGLIPAALADADAGLRLPGKDPGLVVLGDRPLNLETPAHLLDDAVTPGERLFVRNNGVPPSDVDPAAWVLGIAGESVSSERRYSLADLGRQFEKVTLQLTLECAGNGRWEFDPPAPGNQWTTGAVGCPAWSGVRLTDVLADAGLQEDAVYIAYYGADRHLSGDESKRPISRGVPIAKARERHSLIAWGMNGHDLHALHGHPLRLVFGGWPGSCSGKWLERIDVRDRVHDGEKMGGDSYRVPCRPVVPGTPVEDADMCIIESLPVKSLITYPRSGIRHPSGKPLSLRGHAWAGELQVAAIAVSIDFGQSWTRASIDRPANRYAWQRWRHQIELPQRGYYEIWARATDTQGRDQPMVVPGWNPKGYLNNACHRVAVLAT